MAASPPPGYLSDTEFRFPKNKADAILSTVSFPRKEFCRSVIWFPPSQHDGIRQSITSPFQRSSNPGLRPLERLPAELLNNILLGLDLQSLFNFGQTNLKSREAVYSLKQYRLVLSHGLNLVCALLRTGVATSVSLLDCYRALCTKACAICDGFGGFISLLTWERCCYRCFQEAPELQMYSLTAVKRRFQLPKCDMDLLERFKTLPGTYNMEQSTYKSRMTIVSAYKALMFVDEYPYRPSPASLVQRGQILNFMGTCALPYYDTRTGQVEEGVSCAGCQLLVANGCVMREMPFWSWAYEARNTLYSRDGFLEHFRRCKQAQRRWNESDEGEKLPPDLRSLLDHSRQEVDKNT
ncbi:hypothetical protein MHUMG1_07488 [Metarhizium humberi]|uniref:F-box domain-containing protein n=1 Tax=Metarhizium humberi TaxID=2596975 RepID=A0A9P8M8D7_9HYPO|nr:hypothetical protein MHUMG1_07488 [Metarhizium humberi]